MRSRRSHFLLTNGGDLKLAKESVIIPDQLLDVWPGEQISALLDSGNRPAFSRYVSGGDRQKLIHWDLIEQIGKKDVLNVLQSKHLPKPESWRRLLKLWAYIAPEITGYLCSVNKASLRVIPAQGKGRSLRGKRSGSTWREEIASVRGGLGVSRVPSFGPQSELAEIPRRATPRGRRTRCVEGAKEEVEAGAFRRFERHRAQ